ncbi:hypothetical protein DC083_06280 [Ignatzschineria ureiclastica]|uniref:Uncharacterized protein n=1 Tax=Ignatzschineria ureiclastica TaxID=472582 RepID=A0A2U2ADT7_9GAMM|nr:hypothetical protein [Ignatzschineria ureiclastica]PWD80719.1 hypothetical protein DC083_06280 [Ignatzschineria ureiclastica]GGZ95113.1 hypothetical protein GCM10007162_08960 [Ignatzschineria ureiclastica]
MLPTQLVRSLLAKYQAQKERRLYNNWLRQQEDATHARMLEQATIMQNRVPARRPHDHAATSFRSLESMASLQKYNASSEAKYYQQAA